MSSARYFIHCLLQDRGNVPRLLLGSFSDLLQSSIDASARSDEIPETIIAQLKQLSKIFYNPADQLPFYSSYINTFFQDFVQTLPYQIESEASDTQLYAEDDLTNHHFPANLEELIHRLMKWKAFLESIIQNMPSISLPMNGLYSLSSILPSLEVPNCFSNHLTTPHMQSISSFSPDLHDEGYRWNSFKIRDEFGYIHYYSLVKERPMDLIFSLSAGCIIHYLYRFFQNDFNVAKRIQFNSCYNMLPLNAVTMIMERSNNEFSLSELMRSILKKRGVNMDEFFISVAKTRQSSTATISESEFDAILSMEGEVRDYL